MTGGDRGREPLTDRGGGREPLAPTVPGSAELIDIAMKVNGERESITAIATRWRSAAGKVHEHTRELNGAVNTVDGAWQGESADAFDTYMRKYGKAGNALHDALSHCATSLDTVAETLNTAETKVNAITGDLVTRWNTYRADNPKRTDTELAAGIKEAVDQAIADARVHLDDAGKAVTKAATDLRKHMDDRSITFADIPAPGDEKFVPAPGRTVDWRKTPLADPARTTLAGTDGGGSGGYSPGGDGSGGYGSGAPSSGGTVPAPKERVVEWIKQALTIIKSEEMAGVLRKRGIDVSDLDPDDPKDIQRIWTIIYHESGGNPNAQNNWDVNARNGVPSQGLMQTIPPTFQANSLPGHNMIKDPVDNIIAGVLYTYRRYGSLAHHPGIASLESGGGYKPY
ncbi:transglycosylase SLT domain-containing protein [Streptosporangium sp. NPDC087985]|uniref:transglycosylase SLT domain-containing protein n=1 Tax=Streptosporangium sp. NPDC087985 TaxID=3366196 RepID=UPI003818DFBF